VSRAGAGNFVSQLEHAMEKTCPRTTYYLEVFNQLVKRGQTVRNVNCAGLEWCEVDTPADLQEARALVGKWKDRAGKLRTTRSSSDGCATKNQLCHSIGEPMFSVVH
jgi:NDP-sugar pyrophosphorylase family protein